MDVTTQRRCLRAIAGGLILTTAGTIVWSLTAVDSTTSNDPAAGAPQVAAATPEEVASATDQRIVLRPLRGPLYDPPPPPAPAPKPVVPQRREPTPPPPPPLELTLVGTIIEPDQSLAILSDATGNFDVKGIGEPLELSPEGVTLQTIESEQVTLQYRGRKSTVQLDRSKPKKAKAAGRENKRNNNRRPR